MKTYGVGIVGCGMVSQQHRLAFDHSDRLRCAAVFDPASDLCAAAAAATGARQAGSAEEVLTADDVDIVAILTPVFTHADMVVGRSRKATDAWSRCHAMRSRMDMD